MGRKWLASVALVGMLPVAGGELPVMLWRVTAPGEARPDFIAGTIHVSLPEHPLLPDYVSRAIRQCDLFIAEVDAGQVTPEALRPHTRIRSGPGNGQRLPAHVWSDVVAAAARIGVQADDADRLEPWFLVGLLTQPAPDPTCTVDARLFQAAEQSGLDKAYLEAPADQFRALSGVSRQAYDDQLAQLASIRAYHRHLADLYLRGDLPALQQLIQPQDGASLDGLIHDRTAAWLPRLYGLLDRHDAFVAVGIGHVLGPKGLLARLRAKGYQVERVTP